MTGAEMRAIRKRLKMTQAELGKELDIRGEWVGALERGYQSNDRRVEIGRCVELAVRYLDLRAKLK